MSDEQEPSLEDMPDLSDAFEQPAPGFMPWEQRIAPGMSTSGGEREVSVVEEPDKLARACQEIENDDLIEMIERQSDLVHYPMVDLQTTPDTDLVARPTTNEEAWRLFLDEHLYDTRRVSLEHVHVFEWFPIAPGKFHTTNAKRARQMAYRLMERTAGGDAYFSPLGKASMVRGGIGTVRLRPRRIDDEPHYFMTASSNGVCHEGFPVLVPRRFYGPLKRYMLHEGAVPVTLSGEMRYVPDDALTFLGQNREVPLLYLHVDHLEILPAPREAVTGYLVTVAVTFVGRFEGHEGAYVTYASFDPARPKALKDALAWLQDVYVEGQHRGTIVTDFDEVQPRFPDAVLGLPDLMAGKLDQDRVRGFLQDRGLDETSTRPFYLIYREINTHGGAYVEGDVQVTGGDFVGRDQNN
jgi:hypothetical protein